jgi:hypothetical protein
VTGSARRSGARDQRNILVVGPVAFDSFARPTAKPGGTRRLASYFSISGEPLCPVRLVAVVGDDFGAGRARCSSATAWTRRSRVAPGRTFRWRGSTAPSSPRPHARNPAQCVRIVPSPARRRAPRLPLRVPGEHRPRPAAGSPESDEAPEAGPERHHELLDRPQAGPGARGAAPGGHGPAERGGSARAVGGEPAGSGGGPPARSGCPGGHHQEGRTRRPLLLAGGALHHPGVPGRGTRRSDRGRRFVRGRFPRLARALRAHRDALRQRWSAARGWPRSQSRVQPPTPDETGPDEISSRVELLHRMVHFDLEPLF